MSSRHRLTQAIDSILHDMRAEGYLTSDLPKTLLAPPKLAEHGDFACTVAMALGKAMRKNPREIAVKLQERLGNAGGLLEKTEIAGAGYLNLFVAKSAWHQDLRDAVAKGEDFIKSDVGQGQRVLVEFVSANPTGPLHIAHGRGAVVGDVIVRLMKLAGFAVDREYYINDFGNQADIMARSIHLRYGELHGRSFVPPEDFYPGEYISEIALQLKNEFGDAYLDKPESVWLDVFRTRGVANMMERIRADLQTFNVHFDKFVSERELVETKDPLGFIRKLEQAGHVYEEDGKKWFRTTSFGDDKDRVVVRDDGRLTYFATDIAYHYDKLERGYTQLINLWGADHGGYVTRVKAGIAACGYNADSLDVVLFQMVSLSRGGESVRMGKRLGTAVWLRDVLDEAGPDATRYFFIMRRSDAQIEFDIDLATKKSIDNPVYYAQMGYARMCSILRKAQEAGIALPTQADDCLDALVLPEELGLIKTMSMAPDVVAQAATSLEPHQVVHYLQDLIAQFHSYYTKYKHTERVISDDPKKTKARLFLCQGLRGILLGLLHALGVGAPESMYLEAEDAL